VRQAWVPKVIIERITLKKIEEYLRYAAECRGMARAASPAYRLQLHEMAETWEQLAHKRRERGFPEKGLVLCQRDDQPKERQ
jgi:hypothetical protein